MVVFCRLLTHLLSLLGLCSLITIHPGVCYNDVDEDDVSLMQAGPMKSARKVARQTTTAASSSFSSSASGSKSTGDEVDDDLAFMQLGSSSVKKNTTRMASVKKESSLMQATDKAHRGHSDSHVNTTAANDLQRQLVSIAPNSKTAGLAFFQVSQENERDTTIDSAEESVHFASGEAMHKEIEQIVGEATQGILSSIHEDMAAAGAPASSLSLSRLVCLALIGLSVGAATMSSIRNRRVKEQGSEISKRVRKLRVATAEEIKSMFGVDNGSCNGGTELKPGLLMRIQGRVVVKGQELVAPLLNRPCANYSVSVAHLQDDGVHEPTVAFRSASTDFAIELADDSKITVDVHSQDVSLFDMNGGRHSAEVSLDDAADSWRAFLMANMSTGGSKIGCGPSLIGSTPLKFRECALVAGAWVTAVGEIGKDQDGRLRLHPWRPDTELAVVECKADLGVLEVAAQKNKLLPWKRSARKDPLVGRVLVSDDADLLFATGIGAVYSTGVGLEACWSRPGKEVFM